jgi:hypothetical protein
MKNRKQKFDLHESPNLKDLAPRLSSIGKTNTFKVPEYYFDKLPSEILFKTTNLNSVPVTKRLFWNIFQPKYAVAAAIVVVFIIVSIFYTGKQLSTRNQELADFSLEEILTENPELIETMEDDLLFETLIAFTSEGIIKGIDSTSFIDQSIDNSDLLEFLSEENLTPDLLYNL